MYVALVVAALLAVVLFVRPHSHPHPVSSPNVAADLQVRSSPRAAAPLQVHLKPSAAPNFPARSSPNVAADLQVRSTPTATVGPQVRSAPTSYPTLMVPSSPNVAANLQIRSAHPDLPPGVPYATPTDPVQIQSVTFSPDHVHAGDVASARILTTSNAAALTARIGTYQVNVPKVAPGTFALSITVPSLLPTHQFEIVVTAIRADGATAQRVVPVDVDY